MQPGLKQYTTSREDLSLAENSPGRAWHRAKSGAILPRSQIRARRIHQREMLIVVKPFHLSLLRGRGPRPLPVREHGREKFGLQHSLSRTDATISFDSSAVSSAYLC